MMNAARKIRKMIPAAEAIARWRTDPPYMEVYNSVADEFSRLAEIIRTRSKAGESGPTTKGR